MKRFLSILKSFTIPIHGPTYKRYHTSNAIKDTLITRPQQFMRSEFRRDCLIEKVGDLLDKRVTLCGWISHIRRVGNGRAFVVLRDHTDVVQLLLSQDITETFKVILDQLQLEGPISVTGIVSNRPNKMINVNMNNGRVEILVEKLQILNSVNYLPFTPNSLPLPNEDVRLCHRFIDLRRTELQNNIRIRSKVNQTIRKYFEDQSFVEIETPMLFRSTPEGAREFLIPTDRISPGTKFALPQSPQQFKQMLMASGFDRYYQIARCFRDEDLRADRQPEFTQLDMEMSFVIMKDVMMIMEGLMKHLWKSILGIDLYNREFPKISYHEALSMYGSDKPDLRYPFKFKILEQGSTPSDSLYESFKITNDEIIPLNRIDLNKLQNFVITNHPSVEIVKEEEFIEFRALRKLDDHVGSTELGKIRQFLIRMLDATGSLHHEPSFLWVYDFPLFSKINKENENQLTGKPNRIFESMHHPFTAPLEEDIELLNSDPIKVRGQHYDLVLNGCEIGGGSIRIHSASLQEYILKDIIQLPSEYISHFDHLLNALKSGCPPHGGMALGLDRIMAIICNAVSIRDVIAFPKNSNGYDLCVKSPN